VLTLVIDVGSTSSAYDARLDMIIGAPAFTGSTLIGAILAVAGVVGGVLGWRWLRRSRAELRTRGEGAPSGAPGQSTTRRGLLRRGERKTPGGRNEPAGGRNETDATSTGPEDPQDGGVQ